MFKVPVPELVRLPGVRVSVHVPSEGNPFKTTLPVVNPLPGWVIVPIRGGEGVSGCDGIVTFADIPETQPAPLVTV